MRAPFLALLPTLFLSLACTGQAATWTVDTLEDELDEPAGSALSLREAVRDAAPTDTILFAPSLNGGTIVLTRGAIDIAKNLTVDGMSLPGGISISGNNTSRIFSINYAGSPVLKGLNITKGRSTFDGGGINCTGSLTLENCSITECRAPYNGSALNFDSNGSLAMRNCAVTANILDSTSGGGGAIYRRSSSSSSTATLINCTIANNESFSSAAGILCGAGTTHLNHCTVTGNRSGGWSAGVIGGSTLILENSVIAGNISDAASTTPQVIDLGFIQGLQKIGQNFISSNNGATSQFPAGPLVGTFSAPLDPVLSPLALHGGRTFCLVPLSGSPLLNQGTASAATPATDQRGLARVSGSKSDLGSVEVHGNYYFPADGSADVTFKPTLAWSLATSATQYTVMFGASPASLASVGTSTKGLWNLPELNAGTTYYWRVDSTLGGTTTNGPVISFTTRTALVVTKTEDEPPAEVTTIPGISLREAILLANGTPGLDIIRFAPGLAGQQVILSDIALEIRSELRIEGQSIPGGVTISGSSYRILSATEFHHLTIINGRSGNTSSGVVDIAAPFTARNCTITECRALRGGGIYLRSNGSCTLVHCTVTGNHANLEGGGIYTSGGTLALENSIVAGNHALENYPDIRASILPTLRGKNLVGNNSGSGLPAGPLIGTATTPLSPGLAPAGAYTSGGARYCSLLPGSPALGQAVALSTTPNTDQIGQARPGDGTADLGAVEYSSSLQVTVPGNGEQDTVTHPVLSWNSPGTSFEVFFGTDPGALTSLDVTTGGSFQLPELAGNTTYYWRIDSTTSGGTTTGPVHSFTTRGKIVVSTLLDENDATPASGTGISFREAVALANTRAGADNITFAPSLSGGTMSLTLANSVICSSEVTIDASDLPGGITLNRGSTVFSVIQSGQAFIRRLNITSSATTAASSALSITGALTLEDLSVSGIYSRFSGPVSNSGRLIVRRCSFFDNQASSGGAFSQQSSGMARLTNCTFFGNRADFGGAVEARGRIEMIHCTIAGNRSKNGGAISLDDPFAASVILENCIVAGNETLSPAYGKNHNQPDISGYSPALTIRGKNLIGINAGLESVFPTGPLAGTLASPMDAGLLTGATYSGRTVTMPLSAGSPAIDAGLSGTNPPSTDQRGADRNIGSAPDLGAFESQMGEAFFHPLPATSNLGHQATLRWRFEPNSDLYRILLAPIGSPLVEIGTTTGDILAVTLQPSTSYQWQVLAVTGETTLASPVLTFSTRSEIVVTTLEDENDSIPANGNGISLREAISLGASIPGPDYIVISPALPGQIIHLTKGDLVLDSDLEIDGSLPAGRLTLDLGRLSRAFHVDHWQRDVELRNLVIQDAFTSGYGGGIANDGELRLRQVDILNCLSEGYGGAIRSSSTGRLDLENCNLISNKTGSRDSGISDEGLYLRARQTTVAYSKGALRQGFSGAAAISSINLQLTNCTIANNLGLGVSAENAVLVHTTISGNRSADYTGGLYWTGELALKNSIVAGNFSAYSYKANPDLSRDEEEASPPATEGSNLIGSNYGLETYFPAGPLTGTVGSPLAPLLLHLGNYGGTTLTMPPHGRSPARRTSGPLANPLPSDQRGVARTDGLAPDLGAADFSNQTEIYSPQSGSGQVSARPRLQWIFQGDASSYEVFLGSSPAALASLGTTTLSMLEVQDLLPLEIYYWKVVATVGGSPVESAIQHFITREPLTVRHPGDPHVLQAAGLSLRQATEIAEKAEGHDTIILDGSVLSEEGITLAEGPIHLVDGASLLGGGGLIGISGARKWPVLRIWASPDCQLQNLDIHDGFTSYGSPGIDAFASKIRMKLCVMRNNIDTDETGGGVAGGGIKMQACTAELDSCVFTGNQARYGAGIYFSASRGIIRNCTFSNNQARSIGGGIYAISSPDLVMEHCSLVSNSAYWGGGISIVSGYGNDALKLSNCIVAANTAADNAPSTRGDDVYSSSGILIASGNNLIGNNSSCSGTFPAGPRVGTPAAPLDAKLSPLGNFGGIFASHLPLPGSPAIDAAVTLPGSPAFDQRGMPRPLGSAPDLGAIETFPIGTTLVDTDGDGMDDRLEAIFGFTIGIADGDLDADGDGSSNADELGNRSNPHDASDLLRVLGLQALVPGTGETGPTMRVSWASFPGLNYTIELSEDLDFEGSDAREINTGAADGFTGTMDLPLRPGKDFIRVRRD